MHGKRLDQVASQLFSEFSRSRLQAWIRAGKLTVDGDSKRPKDPVMVDQQLVLLAEPEAEISWRPQPIPLDILFEDDDVIVVNKPAGLVVHPAAGHADGTLVNALLHHAPELEQVPRGGIVHRLDKDTSGVMCVARSLRAHTSLVAQLAERSVRREYIAVAIGLFTGGGTIDAPIGRHPGSRIRMAVVASGKPAVTHFRPLERFANHTYLGVKLETGRTHQIRVHLSHRKHPLVGDPLYGGRPRLPAGADDRLRDALQNFDRQALHARTLAFRHPASDDIVSFETPVPEDIEALLGILRSCDRTTHQEDAD